MSLALKPVINRRPFVTAPYIPGEDGRLRPTRPLRCPVAFERGGTCTLYIERWRRRAHGPGFLLCCLRCVDDGISFTVYPPGWVPYGREAVMALDHRGRIVGAAASGSRWEDTAFTAVVDAAAGKLWADVLVLGPSTAAIDAAERCRKTQRRHTAGAMRLFALDAAGTTRERDLVGRAMGVDLTSLAAAAHRIRAGPGLKARGCEGAKVLEQLPAIIATFSGLLALGHARGFWGPALS